MRQRRSADDMTVPVERKLQLTGNSTFVVSLPKAWATAQNLESGMSMYLYPADDRVAATPERVSTQGRAVTIDARTDTSDGVERQVRAAYAAGDDLSTVSLPSLSAETTCRPELVVATTSRSARSRRHATASARGARRMRRRRRVPGTTTHTRHNSNVRTARSRRS